MTPDEFRSYGHRLIDWLADYRTRLADRPVAEEEAHVLLFEPASTLNTGNVAVTKIRCGAWRLASQVRRRWWVKTWNAFPISRPASSRQRTFEVSQLGSRTLTRFGG